jgi:dTMP kinase
MTADASPRCEHPGFFLALDGPDGGGKTTQAQRLVTWLEAQGHAVVACRDPGGTALGDRLRQILLERSTTHISMRAEMLLYMASRAQLVHEVIAPALADGKTVVSDRFLLANVVYQGYAGGLEPQAIWRVGEEATGGLWPDLTVLIDVPYEVARARVGAPRDRMEDRSAEFHRRVRTGFLEAAKNYPAPIVVVEGSQDPDRVAKAIEDEVARALAQHSRT